MEKKEYVCLYCGKEIGEGEVLFWEKVNTMYTDNVRGNFLKKHGVRVPAGNKFPRMYYHTRPENITSVDENGYPTMIEDHLGNALVPEELERAQNKKRDDDFDDDFDSDGSDSDQSERNSSQNRELHNIPKRACPHCHCELPRQFGTIPTHHIAMFGGRAAGKTAYLVNLFQQVQSQLGRNDLGSVQLEEESRSFIQPMIEYYEQFGTTLPTPADEGLLPIICRYQNRDSESFLAFYDIAGEGTGDVAYMANHKGISNCECLMLMIDPNMFVSGAFYGQWIAEHTEGAEKYNDSGDCCKMPLDSFLNQAGDLCHEYADKVRYIVCVVTKLDMLLEAEAKHFGSGDIELITDVKDKHWGAVNLQVLKRVSSELQEYFSKMRRINLKEKVMYTFGKDMQVSILGVSTSTRTEGKEIRFEPRSAAVDPKHRIIEPFLVVLMYFGLVPAKKPDGRIVIYKDSRTLEPEAPPIAAQDPIPEKPKKRHWWSR